MLKVHPYVPVILRLTAVIGIAAALKWFYSQANVNELRWILAPTAILVEWATWSHFTFEPYAGYMNREHTFLIASSCSGVNFLVAAFLMLALRGLWNTAPAHSSWRIVLKAGIMAFGATVVANTLRISIALQTQDVSAGSGWMNSEELHRIQGISVYFGSLLILYLMTEETTAPDRIFPTRRPGVIRRALWPLSIYYGVTLGIPLLSGAFSLENLFWRHSIVVLLVPVLILAIFAAFNAAKVHARKIISIT